MYREPGHTWRHEWNEPYGHATQQTWWNTLWHGEVLLLNIAGSGRNALYTTTVWLSRSLLRTTRSPAGKPSQRTVPVPRSKPYSLNTQLPGNVTPTSTRPLQERAVCSVESTNVDYWTCAKLCFADMRRGIRHAHFLVASMSLLFNLPQQVPQLSTMAPCAEPKGTPHRVTVLTIFRAVSIFFMKIFLKWKRFGDLM